MSEKFHTLTLDIKSRFFQFMLLGSKNCLEIQIRRLIFRIKMSLMVKNSTGPVLEINILAYTNIFS